MMTVPLWCLVATALLLLGTKVPVAVAMHQLGGYNNRVPRAQQEKLTGWGRRALASHQNAFEAFPIFAAGVVVAHVTQANPAVVTNLAVAHVLARVAYSVLYLADIHWLRSIAWFVGYGSSVVLLASPLL